MATVVSLINMKGGVGKTTLAFNLGWYAATSGMKDVLVVDLDPQSNASQYLMGAKKYLKHIQDGNPTIVSIFEQFSSPFGPRSSPKPFSVKDAIVSVRAKSSYGGKIDLIPSQLELSWTLKNPTSKDHLLAKALSEIESGYDLIIIDCAPTESILTIAAYRSSRYILIPVKPEFLAAIGLPLLVRSLTDFQSSFGNHELEIAGIVFTDCDIHNVKPEHNAGRRNVRQIAKEQGWHIFQSEMRHSDSYPRGARDGAPIFHTDYARWWVIGEFNKLGAEFLKKVGL